MKEKSSGGNLVSAEKSGLGNAWLALAMLTLVNILLNLDRTLPQLVIEPIKQEFRLSDGQAGIILGIAFGAPFGIAGLTLGPLIDRLNRKRFLAGLLAVWSIMTFVTGLATNYVHLLLARAGLGAAEAPATSVAMSMIGDTFRPERRSTALGFFKIGVPLGILLAGLSASYLGDVYGWRAVFFVAGLPGVILAAALLVTVREPRRGALEMDGPVQPAPYRAALKFLLCNRVMTPFMFAMLLSVLSSAALAGFSAPFLQRTYHASLKEVGIYLAVASALGALSPILVGILADRLTASRGYHMIFNFLTLYLSIIGAVAIGMIMVPFKEASVFFFVLWYVLNLGFTTPCYATVLTLTPIGMRGTILSMVMVSNMCVGFGTGPVIVGFASDHIGGPHALRYALVIVVGVGMALSTFLAFLAGRGASRASRGDSSPLAAMAH